MISFGNVSNVCIQQFYNTQNSGIHGISTVIINLGPKRDTTSGYAQFKPNSMNCKSSDLHNSAGRSNNSTTRKKQRKHKGRNMTRTLCTSFNNQSKIFLNSKQHHLDIVSNLSNLGNFIPNSDNSQIQFPSKKTKVDFYKLMLELMK
jgi:hypothetical protein